MPVTGWTTWKGGKLHDASLHRTKRDLLIGYDLMPLRGLPQTEKFLASKGIEVARTTVEKCCLSIRHGFCVEISERLSIDSLAWSVTHHGGGVWRFFDSKGHALLSFKSACGFVRSHCEKELSQDEIKSLGMFWFSDLDYDDPQMPSDKRKKRSHVELIRRCREILSAHQIKIVPVRFSRCP